MYQTDTAAKIGALLLAVFLQDAYPDFKPSCRRHLCCGERMANMPDVHTDHRSVFIAHSTCPSEHVEQGTDHRSVFISPVYLRFSLKLINQFYWPVFISTNKSFMISQIHCCNKFSIFCIVL